MSTESWSRRVSVIERTAADVLDSAHVERPPTPVREVAEHLGLKVRPSTFEDKVSGLLVLEEGMPTIGYNRFHPPVRRRFTIAHEIGHFVLHQDASNLFIDKGYSNIFYRDDRASEGKYTRELEANAFAAALLMPIAVLRREIEKRGFDLAEETSLDELAKLFDVSKQAMAYRLANSGVFDSAPDHL